MEQRFVLLVLLCALLHAVWNALLHASEDRVAQLGTMSVPYLLAGAAGALALPPPPAPAWPYVAASALLELGYCAALLRAYRSGDFSRIYPIARGLSPLTVCALALIALGERPTPFALAGIALVSLGIASLALRRGLRWSGESVPYALVTGLFIAAYSVVDGRGVRLAGDPLAYVAWVYLLWNAPQFALICRLRGWRALARRRLARARGRRAIARRVCDRDRRVPASAGRHRVRAARDELDLRHRDRLVRAARAAERAPARRVRARRRGRDADPDVTRRGGARAARRNSCRMPVSATICVRVLDGFAMPTIDDATAFDDARC